MKDLVGAVGNLNFGSLVSEDDFKQCFAHDFMYGDTTRNWPSKTLLIYRLGEDGPFECEVNERGADHAEIVLLKKIRNKIENR